jgi:ABC-2 type transport system ATP-binding protein
VIELREPLDAVPEALAQHDLRIWTGMVGWSTPTTPKGERTGITRLLADIQAAGLHLSDVETRSSSLEEIFVDLVAADTEDAP